MKKRDLLEFEIVVKNDRREWVEPYRYTYDHVETWLEWDYDLAGANANDVACKLGKIFVEYFNRTLKEGEWRREFVCVKSAKFI